MGKDNKPSDKAKPENKTWLGIGLDRKKLAVIAMAGVLLLLIGVWYLWHNQKPLVPEVMVAKKPAIYLYPQTDMQVSVGIAVNGRISASEPEYGSGWTVFASKTGIINGKYDYLFYEAELAKVELPQQGWTVEYGSLKAWFDQTLPRLGLNAQETAQFQEYWLESLPPAKYYEIRLLSKEFLDENLALKISPKPDTVIRTEFHFKPASEKTAMSEPSVVTPQRKGFTVVEWGGMLAN